MKSEAIEVAIVCHPTLLEFPTDLVQVEKAKHIPMLWVSCEK